MTAAEEEIARLKEGLLRVSAAYAVGRSREAMHDIVVETLAPVDEVRRAALAGIGPTLP